MVKMIKEVTDGYIDALLNTLTDDGDLGEELETYLRQQLEHNRVGITQDRIDFVLANTDIDIPTLDEQNVYERILKQELDREYDEFIGGLNKEFGLCELYGDMLFDKHIDTIFTQKEKEDIVNRIDWILTQAGDRHDTLPNNLTEWIARLCNDNEGISVIEKMVSRTIDTDSAVRGCLRTYLDNPDTQILSTKEQIDKITVGMYN